MGLLHSLKMGHFKKPVIDNALKIVLRAFFTIEEFIPPDITINSIFLPRRPEMIEGGNCTREVAKLKTAAVMTTCPRYMLLTM